MVEERERASELINGRYEIVEEQDSHGREVPRELGTGGMGQVLLAYGHREQRPVALKGFHPTRFAELDADERRYWRDLLSREGTTWLQLGAHPHIVRCHNVAHEKIART